MKVAPFALVLGLALLAGAPAPARAATVNVQPGEGTLQAAIDSAADGDSLVLAPETYVGGVTVNGKNNLSIRGRGAVVIDATGAQTGLNVRNVNGLRVERVKIINALGDGINMSDCANVTLSRCTIDNSSGSGNDSGIEIGGAQDGVTVDRCTFVKWSYGIYLSSTTDDPKARFTRCKVQGGLDSETITAYDKNTVISGNLITGPKDSPSGYGVYVGRQATGSTVERNRVSYVSDPGITVLSATTNVERNSIRNVTGIGIQVNGGPGTTITRNTVKNSGGAAFDVTVGGNTFTKNAASGTTAVDLNSGVAESENTYSKNRFRTTNFPVD